MLILSSIRTALSNSAVASAWIQTSLYVKGLTGWIQLTCGVEGKREGTGYTIHWCQSITWLFFLLPYPVMNCQVSQNSETSFACLLGFILWALLCNPCKYRHNKYCIVENCIQILLMFRFLDVCRRKTIMK